MANFIDFFKMMQAIKKREYRLRIETVFYIFLAILYLILPFDVIPDFFVIVGMTDDVAVFGVVAFQIKKEIECYREKTKKGLTMMRVGQSRLSYTEKGVL